MGDNLRESVDSVEDGSNNDWDLLEDGVRGKEESVLLGPALDELLILVKLLESLKINDINVNVRLLHFFGVFSIGDQADLELGTGHIGQPHTSDETFVLLWIVILEGNL